ncbi:hypothetical protein QTN94_07320 [Vibrio sp. M250220]|uniref:hypothetical protein n=1 Tax=Vibrio sp. M250220 TaxID=3020894 RepID=UPI002F425754
MHKRISTLFSILTRKSDARVSPAEDELLNIVARDIVVIKFMVTGLYLWLLAEHLLFPLMEAFGTNPY